MYRITTYQQACERRASYSALGYNVIDIDQPADAVLATATRFAHDHDGRFFYAPVPESDLQVRWLFEFEDPTVPGMGDIKFAEQTLQKTTGLARRQFRQFLSETAIAGKELAAKREHHAARERVLFTSLLAVAVESLQTEAGAP